MDTEQERRLVAALEEIDVIERRHSQLSAGVPVRFDRPAPRYEAGEPFGAWLLIQRDRGDWIDELAAHARADRTFPKRGDPEAVRKHLSGMGAEADLFEQLDDAERCWRSLLG